ncbi:MAG: DUF87 domain-containing protein [Desulfurococcales archaeon]|nr:DUF87 domain-containing protein [Desulfurococcales archaeon]
MDPFLAFIGAMSAASLALLLKGTFTQQAPRPSLAREGDLEVSIEGERLHGVVYVSEDLPASERDPGRRVFRIARDAGVSVSIVSSLYKVRRDRILSRLEESLARVEAAYSVSRSARLKSMLETLSSLYEEVALTSQPYWGSLGVVVWVPEGPEGLARAEAFKTLLEAELGITLKRVPGGSCMDAIAPPPGPRPASKASSLVMPPRQHSVRGYPVILGWRLDVESAVYALDYPGDFAAHIGIVGPTGRGKTVLLAGVVAQLAAASEAWGEPWRIVVVDPKGDLASLVSEIGGGRVEVYGPEVDAGEGVRVIGGLWSRRESLGGPVVVVVDEAWRHMSLEPSLFEAIAREGRSLGFHLVYAVQEPSDIPGAVADNTGTFIVFGGKTESYSELAARLGVRRLADELLELPVGEAIIARRDSRPVPIRVVDFGKLLKTASTTLQRPRSTGEQWIGQEPAPTENGEGLAHIQEPRPHTPRPGEVPTTNEGDPQG